MGDLDPGRIQQDSFPAWGRIHSLASKRRLKIASQITTQYQNEIDFVMRVTPIARQLIPACVGLFSVCSTWMCGHEDGGQCSRGIRRIENFMRCGDTSCTGLSYPGLCDEFSADATDLLATCTLQSFCITLILISMRSHTHNIAGVDRNI